MEDLLHPDLMDRIHRQGLKTFPVQAGMARSALNRLLTLVEARHFLDR